MGPLHVAAESRTRSRQVAPATAKAAILTQQQAPLVVAEVEIPPLDVGQVLVRLASSGICGKQVDEITGKRGADRFLPHLLGHEGAGTVVEVGPGVRKVAPGDRVVLHWMKGSGIDSATPSFRWNSRPLNAGWVTTFSEYTVASENRITPIGPGVALEAACLLGCAVTTGLGIVFNEAGLKPGESLAVFGAGGVGLNVVQGARLVHGHPIVVVDVQPHKLEQARAMGATHALSAREEGIEPRLRELSGGRGFDVAVDTTGDPRVFELAYRVTGPAGRTVMAGVIPHERPVTIDPYPLHFGRRMIGSHGGATNPDRDIPRYAALAAQGALKLEEQITHRFRLEQINDAVEVVRAGSGGKCVITMGDGTDRG